MVLIEDVYGWHTFVTIGFAMIVVARCSASSYSSAARCGSEAIDAGDQAEATALRGRLAGFGILDTVLLLFTITAMVLRLGA